MPALTGFGAFDDIPAERISDKITRRTLSGAQGMMVWWEMKAGAHAAAHSHPHEQLVWIVSGKMDFRIGDERRVMGPGDVAVIPGGVEHEGWFPEELARARRVRAAARGFFGRRSAALHAQGVNFTQPTAPLPGPRGPVAARLALATAANPVQ